MGLRGLACGLLAFALLGMAACAKDERVAVLEGVHESAQQEDVMELPAKQMPPAEQLTLTPSPSSLPTHTPAPSPSATLMPTSTPSPGATPSPSPSPPFNVKRVNNESGYILGHDVNLRAGPGVEYKKIATLSFHSKLTITGKTDAWYRVKTNAHTGFVLKEYIGLGGIPTPAPKPASTPKSTSTPRPASTPRPTPKPQIEQGEKGDYTDEEVYLVAKLIYAEGKNQSESSFLAMANVLYNRCNSKRFGGTVEQEVYRKNQFTVVRYESFASLSPSDAAKKAAHSVMNGGKRVLPADVLFFRTEKKGRSWSSHKYYDTIGGNCYFY